MADETVETESAGTEPEAAEADALALAMELEEGAVDDLGGEEVPEMPVARSVRPAKEREWEDAFNDLEIELTVLLGRATMQVQQLLKMGRGAVIELNANVDDDATIYANNRLIARGQVVVVGENIAVSITETVPMSET